MGVLDFNQIFIATYRRNYASDPQTLSRYKNVLEVLCRHAKFGGARISPAAGAAQNVEFCLFVCLSVRHAYQFQRLCNRFRHEGIGVQKRLWYRWIRKVCSCAPVFNFLRLLPIGDTSKCRKVQKTAKLGFFAATGRQNKPIETKFRR